jgi:hypothetical protein
LGTWLATTTRGTRSATASLASTILVGARSRHTALATPARRLRRALRGIGALSGLLTIRLAVTIGVFASAGARTLGARRRPGHGSITQAPTS